MINNCIPSVLLLCLFAINAGAQDAAPADRNAINTTARPGGMIADSPVKFPATGALPAKFQPDMAKDSTQIEGEYLMVSTNSRSVEQIRKIRSDMPGGAFKNPAPDWEHLPRTRRILKGGGGLHVMGIGDSIVADTFRSGWLSKLQEAYPKATIHGTVYVKGGGGCHHFKEEGRIAKYVVPQKPDLVFLGGISQRDIASIKEVIRQLREGLPEVEILLATGTFGTVDPRDLQALTAGGQGVNGSYGSKLKALASEENCAFLDMNSPWAEYIRISKVHPHRFYRDPVHANEHGEQILAKILLLFFREGEPS